MQILKNRIVKNRFKALPLLLFLLFITTFSNAQQNQQYTQFYYNKLVLNSGYTGARGVLSTRLLYRNQWMGAKFDGAPQTVTFSIHSPFKKENNAMGLYVFNDRLGVTNQTAINITYAYRVPLNKKMRLNFGFNAGMRVYKSNLADLDRVDMTDEAYYQNVKRILPELGAGIYLTHPKFYVGLSSPNFIKASVLSKNQEDLLAYGTNSAHSSPHIIVMAGGVIPCGKALKIRPQVMGQTVVNKGQNAPFQADFNLSLLIVDRLNIGGGYRMALRKKNNLENHDSFMANIEIWPAKTFMIGYSYDYALNRLGNFHNGTHEIILGYDVFKRTCCVGTPKHF